MDEVGGHFHVTAGITSTAGFFFQGIVKPISSLLSTDLI